MGSKNKPIDEINLDVVVGIDIENISLILFKSGFMSFLLIFVLLGINKRSVTIPKPSLKQFINTSPDTA